MNEGSNLDGLLSRQPHSTSVEIDSEKQVSLQVDTLTMMLSCFGKFKIKTIFGACQSQHVIMHVLVYVELNLKLTVLTYLLRALTAQCT